MTPHRPIRLAFVGQETYFDSCAMDRPAGGVEPSFLDFRSGADARALRGRLDELDPDVVLTFRPEIVPEGTFAGLRALTVGFLTEPLPRPSGIDHPDLERRMEYLRAMDPSQFDRIVSFDPLVADAAEEVAPVWRSLPLPVADGFFAPARPPSEGSATLFVGRSTEHREEFLIKAKHEFDVVHVAHGLSGERLREALQRAAIAINLHNEPYPSFENRVCLSLAAGLLVLSEPLDPTHGLEPGLDFVEVPSPAALYDALWNARHRPEAFHRVRVRGRAKAERYRASRVYPELVRDLVQDVAAFGTERAR